MTGAVHRYRTGLAWEGSTAAGYDAYPREHTVVTDPATAGLHLSADPAFRGDPAHLNPEQLLVAAASSCQLLSFLAVAARARLDVVAYADDAEGEMPEDVRPIALARIRLRPRITVRAVPGGPAVDEARVRHLCEVAHRECFIANSLRTEVTVDPQITIVDELT